MGFGERKLRRIGKSRHPFRPVTAAQDNAIPILMHLRRGVAKIGDRAVFHPSAATVNVGRVAALTVIRDVKFFTLTNNILVHFLLGRPRHGRDFDVRSRKWNLSSEFESIQAFGAALGFGCGHGARGSEEARSGTPTHGSDDVLLAVYRKSDGDGIDCGLGLDGPKFFAGVSSVGCKFAGALSLKNEIAGRGEYPSVDGNLLLDGPARGFRNGVPRDQPAEETLAAFSRFDGGFCIGPAIRCRNRSEERRVGKECRSRWSPYH